MKSMVGTYDIDLRKYKLKFEEPDDTIIDGQTRCTVQKVVIVRKKDSEPSNETDGTVVLTVERANFGQHVDTFFVDESLTPNDGDIYYYKAFPMGDGGLYNTSSKTSVYIRKNITEKTTKNEEDGYVSTSYEYDEAKLTKAEYRAYLAELSIRDIQQQRADIDYLALMLGIDLEV